MDTKITDTAPRTGAETLVCEGRIGERSDATEFHGTAAQATGEDFQWALLNLKCGNKVRRAGWNGKGMFLFLVPGSTFKVNRPPLLGIYPEGTEVQYHAHIDMKTAQGYVVPWLASQADLLAYDWELA